MMPHEMFIAILSALSRHGISGPSADAIAHTIMDEFEEPS